MSVVLHWFHSESNRGSGSVPSGIPSGHPGLWGRPALDTVTLDHSPYWRGHASWRPARRGPHGMTLGNLREIHASLQPVPAPTLYDIKRYSIAMENRCELLSSDPRTPAYGRVHVPGGEDMRRNEIRQKRQRNVKV